MAKSGFVIYIWQRLPASRETFEFLSILAHPYIGPLTSELQGVPNKMQSSPFPSQFLFGRPVYGGKKDTAYVTNSVGLAVLSIWPVPSALVKGDSQATQAHR